MKRFFISWLTGMALVAGVNAGAEVAPLLQIHFAGAQQIGADPASAAAAGLYNGPEGKALIAQTLDKMARLPRTWLADSLPANAGDGAAFIRPLLDDLINSEWYLSAVEAGRAKPDFTLAVRLNAARDGVWQQNVAGLLAAWGCGNPQKIAGGLAWSPTGSPVTVRLEHYQGWLIFSAGGNAASLDRRWLTGAKPGAWLTVDADWQRIVRRWPELTLTDLPDMHLEVKGFPGGLLLQGRGVFPGAAPVSPTAWQVPVRLIHEPFVSFTAARGFAPWLNEQKWFQPYAISPTPNQVFFWASPRSSFNSYAAIPVPSASGALKQAGDRLTAKFAQLNQAHFFAAPQKLNVSSNVVSVANLPPFYFPNLKPWQEPAGQFLTGGFFATAPGLKPIPANLRAQLDAPGVVYYDWESTSHRLPDLLQLFQINLVLTKHKQLEGKSAAAKWLKAIEPKLGDSVTVVKQTRPNELTFTRSAATGLTAVELESLAHWLEAPNFPGCDLRMPLRRPLHPRLSPPGPGAPMNSPAH